MSVRKVGESKISARRLASGSCRFATRCSSCRLSHRRPHPLAKPLSGGRRRRAQPASRYRRVRRKVSPGGSEERSTAEEVASFLEVPTWTVMEWRRQGEFHTVGRGATLRFSRESVRELAPRVAAHAARA